MRQEMHEIKAELKQEIAKFRAELKQEIAEVKQEISATQDRYDRYENRHH